MVANSEVSIVGVDWGTTHRRAYAINGQGQCLHDISDADGALACKGRFPAALDAALAALGTRPAGVVLAGMVGSALGWHEVPYVDSQVPVQALAAHALRVTDAGNGVPTIILPGYSVRNTAGLPDVMRGEETQLLGAWALGHRSGWFVLPGTHSKWVQLDEGRVLQLRTYMTGELFDLLRRHGTVAAAAGTAEPVWDAAAFAAGVQAAGAHALSHQIFSARARVVCKDMPATSTTAYLSGLLIGTELKDVLHDSAGPLGTFKLLGSPQLAAHYQSAAQLLGLSFDILDAQAAFVAAMHHIHQNWTLI
ncbi:2-dehydro-3-deoxygalactonokinase [uncultured Rhodoferax sp.]|uniref:2-dehydro-3-deoxygalactonokinase n=1 Tax=uncultured Rhodoferax sp. TaxID=223188 RepID=UPI002600BDB8|nr:2-dehydro-3-deoxygalactonokinase [uncultured Rhodoferax sp.]